MSQIPKSDILLPLYIYPDPGAWDPLYASIEKHPNLNFTVIVNPNSGPGCPPWWPNEDYVREIPKLNGLPNVRTVGYVRTDYCKRPITEVFHDISVYEDWANDSQYPGLGVDGIFFDETPNLYSEHAESYLHNVSRRVKESKGIRGAKLVIHNPGTAVDARLANCGADVITVAEESYERFQTKEYQEWMATSTSHRLKSCFIVHSVPRKKMEELVGELREKGGFVFVTELKEQYYSRFEGGWKEFVESMARD